MKLSNRIIKIIKMCNYSDIIIDVGCDHGYIAIALIMFNKCKNCYAVDVNELPLQNAICNINKYKLNDKIKCIKSDGFDFLNFDNQKIGAIIAGMGGSTIVNIIKNSIDKVRNMDYVLIQPNAYPKDIRKFLIQKNFYIEKEEIVFSNGAYYEYILIFPKSQEILNEDYEKKMMDFEYDIPMCIIDNKDGEYNNYINFRIFKYKKILKNLLKKANKDNEKLKLLNKRISILEGYIK